MIEKGYGMSGVYVSYAYYKYVVENKKFELIK